MSYVRIWVHLVFTTKNREPLLLLNEVRKRVIEHIQYNSKMKNIWLDSINGQKEHIHCLILLNKEQSISKVAQMIKGESSYWINKNKLIKSRFEWQDDYFAVSISESQVDKVRAYIANQEEHHRKKSFTEEVEEFMKKYGFKIWDGSKNG